MSRHGVSTMPACSHALSEVLRLESRAAELTHRTHIGFSYGAFVCHPSIANNPLTNGTAACAFACLLLTKGSAEYKVSDDILST